MGDWNVVITVRDGGFARARRLLQQFGPVRRTGFYNVLLLRVDDVHHLLEELRQRVAEDARILDFVSRIMPVFRTFTFQSPEEFEARAREAVLAWASELAGKAFHVRLHRRGFKGRLATPEVERLLAEALLEALVNAGTPGRIVFADPDAIVAVETIGNQAGMALWTRADLQRYPFFGLAHAAPACAGTAEQPAVAVRGPAAGRRVEEAAGRI
jgi:tRNA(Ser,Leu) C12 N-acetylase TAN1